MICTQSTTAKSDRQAGRNGLVNSQTVQSEKKARNNKNVLDRISPLQIVGTDLKKKYK